MKLFERVAGCDQISDNMILSLQMGNIKSEKDGLMQLNIKKS